jgi:hypothetical protein
VRLHIEGVPVLLASSTGLPGKKTVSPQRVLPHVARTAVE